MTTPKQFRAHRFELPEGSPRVRVLTTENEHEELRRAAEAASMSVSTWVRYVALERARSGR